MKSRGEERIFGVTNNQAFATASDRKYGYRLAMGKAPASRPLSRLAEGDWRLEPRLEACAGLGELFGLEGTTAPQPDPADVSPDGDLQEDAIQSRGQLADGGNILLSGGNHAEVPNVEVVAKLSSASQLAGKQIADEIEAAALCGSLALGEFAGVFGTSGPDQLIEAGGEAAKELLEFGPRTDRGLGLLEEEVGELAVSGHIAAEHCIETDPGPGGETRLSEQLGGDRRQGARRRAVENQKAVIKSSTNGGAQAGEIVAFASLSGVVDAEDSIESGLLKLRSPGDKPAAQIHHRIHCRPSARPLAHICPSRSRSWCIPARPPPSVDS